MTDAPPRALGDTSDDDRDSTLRHPTDPEELAELLDDPYAEEQGDGNWVMTCPAHPDSNPSLVVGPGIGRRKGRLVVHCRAGCSYTEIVTALMLQNIDLEPPRKTRNPQVELAQARAELDAALGGVTDPPLTVPLTAEPMPATATEAAETAATPRAPGEQDNTDQDADAASGAENRPGDDGGDAGGGAEPADSDDSDPATSRAQLQELHALWAAARALPGTPGLDRYLVGQRGLPAGGLWLEAIKDGGTVRFCAAGAIITKDGKQRAVGPALIARITRGDGRVTGYQVITLDAQDLHKTGSFIVGKAPPGVAGIRLNWRDGSGQLPALVLAEGLETGLSRLAGGIPGPVMLWITCGGLPLAIEKFCELMVKDRIARAEGAQDYRRRWSRIELSVDRDKDRDVLVAARLLNAVTRLEVLRLHMPGRLSQRNADLNDVLQAAGADGVFETWLEACLNTRLLPGACLIASDGKDDDIVGGLLDLTWRNAHGRTQIVVLGQVYRWYDADRSWRQLDDTQLAVEIGGVVDNSFEYTATGKIRRLGMGNSTIRLNERILRRYLVAGTETAIDQLGGAHYRLDSTYGAVRQENLVKLVGGVLFDVLTRQSRSAEQLDFTLQSVAVDPADFDRVPVQFEALLTEAFAAVDGATDADIACQIGRTYEMLGHAVVGGGSLNLQRFILLVGVTGTGKSVVVLVLKAMLDKQMKATSLSLLGSRFGLANLVAADVVLIPDARAMYSRSRSAEIVLAMERILQGTGGDPVPVELKGKDAFDIKLTQCWIAVLNEIPSGMIDHAGALSRRLELIKFGPPPPARKVEPDLADRIITEELSGIFSRALDGLDRLRATRSFSTSPGVEQIRDEQLTLIQPLREFARYIVDDPGGYLLRSEIYDAYKVWMEEEDRGAKAALSPRSFWPALRVASGRPLKRSMGRTPPYVRGIGWSLDTPEVVRVGTPRHRRDLLKDLDDAIVLPFSPET